MHRSLHSFSLGAYLPQCLYKNTYVFYATGKIPKGFSIVVMRPFFEVPLFFFKLNFYSLTETLTWLLKICDVLL